MPTPKIVAEGETLRVSYQNALPVASRLLACLEEQLRTILEGSGVALGVPMESRLKTWESIEEKLVRKSLRISQLSDISDIVGIRLILLFRDDLQKVERLIADNFEIVQSEDASNRLDATQFGYQSSHYVVRIPLEWESIPTMNGLRALTAEFQVRTISQHIWAAASHKLQYKHEQSVPMPLRRSIHRVSALLETVDLELSRVLAERDLYISKAANPLTFDVPLNVNVVIHLLDALLPPENKWTQAEDYDGLIENLRELGILSSHQLKSIIERHLQEVLKDDHEVAKRLSSRDDLQGELLDRVSRPAYFTHVALTRNTLRLEFGRDDVDAIIKCGHEKAFKSLA